METPPSSTSFRPPDEIVPDSQSSDNESQELIRRVRLYDEIVPYSQDSASSDDLLPRKLQRRRRAAWSVLRARTRDAMQQVRVLIFVHTSDPKLCLRIRLCVVMRWKKIGWMALLQSSNTHASDLEGSLQALQALTDDDDVIDSMLASIAAHVLCGHVNEYRPLLARLSVERFRRFTEVFDGSKLETLGQAENVRNPAPWFRFETQANTVRRPLSLQELEDFDHTSKWSAKETDHLHKLNAFDSKAQRAREVSNLMKTINILKCDAATHADDIESASALRKEMSTKDKLMIRRMRKYRLFPTADQRKKLHQFMGTCRWTYNQGVAHFRKTNVSSTQTLRKLYVTEKSKKKREYPEGMEPPPPWVFETPKNFRFNALRKFESGVKSAFSNKSNGNTSKFKIQFKSRKKDGRYFTFCEDAGKASIACKHGESRAMLSISNLKDIPIRCNPGIEIANEIQITNTNGFWYAVISQYVRPSEYVDRGRTIALDPGMKAFMTGVDLEGNALHIGRGNREHLGKYRARIRNAQQEVSLIKSYKGHRSGRQWRAFARAKRAFHCATAKLSNCVKEMHYQTSAYLTKHYDTIILPIFNSKDMVKKSSARNHTFNRLLLGLKHFQFRKLLQAKCELMGKALVVCSEMYSSQTCGRCSKRHLRLGNKDVFECPHCEHVAGRDVNAAFNILRFVCAGSLADDVAAEDYVRYVRFGVFAFRNDHKALRNRAIIAFLQDIVETLQTTPDRDLRPFNDEEFDERSAVYAV